MEVKQLAEEETDEIQRKYNWKAAQAAFLLVNRFSVHHETQS